jgi:hypothetical protein
MRTTTMIVCITLSGLIALSGCGKKEAKNEPTATPAKPREAATQLQQAFVAAEPEVKSVANAASQALQTSDYESAVQSLEMIKQKGNLSVDQGMAVQNSMISLEARLIAAMGAGDANAKRAYEQLKRARRN